MKNKSLFLSGFFVVVASFGCLSAMVEEPPMQEVITNLISKGEKKSSVKNDNFTNDMIYIIQEITQILKGMDTIPSIESVKKAIEGAKEMEGMLLFDVVEKKFEEAKGLFAIFLGQLKELIIDIGKERPDLKEISEHLEIYMNFLFLQKAFARDFAFKELNISADELNIEIISLKKLCDKLKNNEFNEEIVGQIGNMLRAQLKSEGRVECQKAESLYEKILSFFKRKLEYNSLFKEYESLFKEITTMYFSQMCNVLQAMIRLNINRGARIEKIFDEGAVKCALSMYPEIESDFVDRVTSEWMMPREWF